MHALSGAPFLEEINVNALSQILGKLGKDMCLLIQGGHD